MYVYDTYIYICRVLERSSWAAAMNSLLSSVCARSYILQRRRVVVSAETITLMVFGTNSRLRFIYKSAVYSISADYIPE